MKKVFIPIFVFVFLITALFTGCGDTVTGDQTTAGNSSTGTAITTAAAENDPVTPAGQMPIVKEKITISAFIPQTAWVSDLIDNKFTRWLEEQTNIHLDISSAVSEAVNDKVTLLLASGEYPEIFLSRFTNQNIMKYALVDKILMPLNPYIDKYGFEIKKAFDEIPTLKGDITTPDGNIYGIPGINACYHCQVPKAWINTSWLTKLGLSMPTTTDELEAVLKAFKNNDPNGNKKKDEIPFSGAVETWAAEPQWLLMNSFILCDAGNKVSAGDNFLLINDGKVDTCANKPQFKEGLKYIKRLFDEGLIDPAAFTQKADQLNQLGSNPDVEILGAYSAGHLAQAIDITTPRGKDYDVLPPIKGPDGNAYVRWHDANRIAGYADFVITNKCKNPEAAFRMCDFIYNTETTLRMNWGPKDETWKDAGPDDKGSLGTEAVPAKFTLTNGYNFPVGNYFWSQVGPFKLSATVRSQVTQDWNDLYSPVSFEIRLNKCTDVYKPYKAKEQFFIPFMDEGSAKQISQIQAPLVDYINQATLKFITGKMDIDKEWDSYVAQIDKLGMPDFIQLNQKAYDSNK